MGEDDPAEEMLQAGTIHAVILIVVPGIPAVL
jgi:hypothetical protein